MIISFNRYESHYSVALGRKKGKKDAEPAKDDPLAKKKSKKDAEPAEDDPLTKKKSNHVQRKLEKRRQDNKAKIDPHVEEQFLSGRLYGRGY